MSARKLTALAGMALLAATARAEEAGTPAHAQQHRMHELQHREHLAKANNACLAGLGVILLLAATGAVLARRSKARWLICGAALALSVLWVGYWSMLTF